VIACGLFHFIPDLEPIVEEVARVARPGGLFAFTTKAPKSAGTPDRPYERLVAGDLDVYNHFPDYVARLLIPNTFISWKTMRCFVGEDIFYIWITRQRR
jgi:predicted TPR repeat methyltransferase